MKTLDVHGEVLRLLLDLDCSIVQANEILYVTTPTDEVWDFTIPTINPKHTKAQKERHADHESAHPKGA